MSVSIQDLRERRNATAKNLHTLLDEHSEDWNAEHNEKYDAGIKEIQDLDAQIERHQEVMAAIEKEAKVEEVIDRSHTVTDKSRQSELFAKWLRGGDKSLTAEDWAEYHNTMSTTTDSEGGYSVQSDVAAELIKSLLAYGGMRSVSRILSTEKGNPLSFPTNDSTAEVGELIAENTTATSADPTFGTVALNAYKYSSKIVAAPFELLQDSQIDVEGLVGEILMDRLGRITNQHYTTGTGTGQPRGVVTGSATGKTGTTGQTTSVIFDDLVDLVHSIDPAYRASGNCRWMMNDSTFGYVHKLKDSQNRPVFLPGYAGLGVNMGDQLLGYQVTINQDVADMAANAKSILFGDFNKYIIRDVMAMELFRFADSPYIKLGQIGFLAWMRTGGNLVDTAAVKHYANSAT